MEGREATPASPYRLQYTILLMYWLDQGSEILNLGKILSKWSGTCVLTDCKGNRAPRTFGLVEAQGSNVQSSKSRVAISTVIDHSGDGRKMINPWQNPVPLDIEKTIIYLPIYKYI